MTEFKPQGTTGNRFVVQNHMYVNTGGGCMVSVFQVWLLDEHRTVFLSTDAESCSISTGDYINHTLTEIEDGSMDEANTVANYVIDILDGDEPYFELVRYCLIEYMKKDCKYSNYTNYTQLLPLHMLTPELMPDADYVEWHLNNIGGAFETDGYTVFLDDDYKPLKVADELRPAARNAVRDFRAAFSALQANYDEEKFAKLSDKYPFAGCFDELVANVQAWCEELLDETDRE